MVWARLPKGKRRRWASSFPTYMSKLESLQNKAVKIIGGGFYQKKPKSILR